MDSEPEEPQGGQDEAEQERPERPPYGGWALRDPKLKDSPLMLNLKEG